MKLGDQFEPIEFMTKVENFDQEKAELVLASDNREAYEDFDLILKQLAPEPQYAVFGLKGIRNLYIKWEWIRVPILYNPEDYELLYPNFPVDNPTPSPRTRSRCSIQLDQLQALSEEEDRETPDLPPNEIIITIRKVPQIKVDGPEGQSPVKPSSSRVLRPRSSPA